jgi:hypothetical protein
MNEKGGMVMKVQVVGIQKMEFPDKETGELIRLTKLHCVGTDQESTRDMVGQRCEAIATRMDCSKIEVGGYYCLIYDRPLGSSASTKPKLAEVIPVSELSEYMQA